MKLRGLAGGSVVSHLLCVSGGVALCVTVGLGRAPAPQPEAMDAKAMQEGMKKWMDAMKPGSQHEFLAKMVGTWTTKTKITMMPGAPAMETAGEATIRMVHGGRFLLQENTGKMLLPAADGSMKSVDMTGMGMTGFDNLRKQFVMCWTDNMTTGMLTANGSLSQDGKTITMFGQMDEPMTGETGKFVRYVTTMVDKDTWKFQIDEVQYGAPFTVVEVEYSRKAKADVNK